MTALAGFPGSGRPLAERALFVLLVLIVYVFAGRLGLTLATINPSASAVWPPTGIALATLLLLGTRFAPVVWIGAFLVNVWTSGATTTSAAIATGNALEALVGAFLVRRFAGGVAAFEEPGRVLLFTALAGVSACVSAGIGVASLVLTGRAEWADAIAIFSTWWAGDTVGAVLFTPPIVLWCRPSAHRWTRRETRDLLALVLGLGAISLHLFGGQPWFTKAVTFLCLPPLVWAALRLGPRGAATATCALSGFALWGSLRGFGPFADAPPAEELLLLQGFMGIIGVMTLALAAAVAQMRAREDDLRAAHTDLEERVALRTRELGLAVESLQDEIEVREHAEARARESEYRLAEAQVLAHVGSWSWDLESGAMIWSDGLYRILGRSPEEVPPGIDSLLSHVHSDDRLAFQELLARARDGGARSSFDVRAVRSDGQIVWLQGLVEVVGQRGVPVRLNAIARDVTESRLAAADRDRLEKEILEVGSRERQRLGEDLHDGLGQHLTGIAFLVKSLERKLHAMSMHREASDMEHIRELVNDAISKTRSLARGLSPASLETGGLAGALHELAGSAETLFNVSCSVHVSNPAISCGSVADTHLYYIAQESITNAIKHGRAQEIRIRLGAEAGRVTLRVQDDGKGYDPASAAGGMGLRIMRHRARMIDGECDICPRPEGGTEVTCSVKRAADLDKGERTG